MASHRPFSNPPPPPPPSQPSFPPPPPPPTQNPLHHYPHHPHHPPLHQQRGFVPSQPSDFNHRPPNPPSFPYPPYQSLPPPPPPPAAAAIPPPSAAPATLTPPSPSLLSSPASAATAASAVFASAAASSAAIQAFEAAGGDGGGAEVEEEEGIREAAADEEAARGEEEAPAPASPSPAAAPDEGEGACDGGFDVWGVRGAAAVAGSTAERKVASVLAGERIENNRLKKPTTFICKLKFRNELPDPTAQPKLLSMNTNKDQYTRYTITSLEKMYKPELVLEPDLGIPLDLLDLSVYNVPKVCPPLDPEDEALLQDSELTTPVKHEGIKRKERPDGKGVSWLVKTQYISPLSTDSAKMSITEKQAKELRETREGRNIFLENLNSREKQIQAIEESFKASKLRPVHQTNPKLQPVEILPLLPDFERYDDRFVTVAFDNDPTADCEIFNKVDRSVRDESESQAIMKSFVSSGSDPSKSEKFLAYMVPAPEELSKNIYDEDEDVAYSWIREYHWDVRGDDADDPTTYLVNFDDDAARYWPLPTKLVLQKKRAKEGRSNEEVEQYPVPSRVTVRRRSTVAAIELKDSRDQTNSKGDVSLKRRPYNDDGFRNRNGAQPQEDMDQFSGEEDMSD
ncbi:hypothetical protein QJS10_CPA01g00522 [Acorus calamus]|uniref:Protein PAF1 homolog n=1 Tax=Acorus calamus TaxID=4465 RepID=A0AAV9FNH7_ACOCL|nr:hypothetical protein QJS10_CPA01g00522 [Acorus calamus]